MLADVVVLVPWVWPEVWVVLMVAPPPMAIHPPNAPRMQPAYYYYYYCWCLDFDIVAAEEWDFRVDSIAMDSCPDYHR